MHVKWITGWWSDSFSFMNCDKRRGHAIIEAILGVFIDPKASQINIFTNKQLVAIDKQAGYTNFIITGTNMLLNIIINVKIWSIWLENGYHTIWSLHVLLHMNHIIYDIWHIIYLPYDMDHMIWSICLENIGHIFFEKPIWFRINFHDSFV